ncbi:MAG TPA: hypothetical protein VFD92_06205 [Candidatus Binatia bacterium]|nr:hypothetical protein [Candidatus Binatia bacterium]
MDRALRILTVAGCGFAIALAIAGCSSSDCQFEFEEDAVTRDGTPWVCSAGSGRDLTIAFFADGTGTLDGVPFTWEKTFCRNVDLDPSDSPDVISLSEVGGNVEVGRLTFVLGGETFLCGYGVPPT